MLVGVVEGVCPASVEALECGRSPACPPSGEIAFVAVSLVIDLLVEGLGVVVGGR